MKQSDGKSMLGNATHLCEPCMGQLSWVSAISSPHEAMASRSVNSLEPPSQSLIWKETSAPCPDFTKPGSSRCSILSLNISYHGLTALQCIFAYAKPFCSSLLVLSAENTRVKFIHVLRALCTT